MTERLKVVEIDGIEYLVSEKSNIDPVEFRLYYDEQGKVLFYTCEKPEGNYILVDQQIYSEMRYDWRVIDKKLTKLVPGIIISKLKPNDFEGKSCAREDITIIVDDDYPDKQKWKLISYELQ